MSALAIVGVAFVAYCIGFFTCSLFSNRRIRAAEDRAELAEYQRGQLMETIAERTDQAGRKEVGV